MSKRAAAVVPDQQTLREHFDYDASTGRLLWRVATSRRVRVGAPAGYIRPSDGRRAIRLNGCYFRSDYATWIWHYGTLPKMGIAHRNGDLLDDRLSNLIDANTAIQLPPADMPEVRRTRKGKFRVTLQLGEFDCALAATLCLARAKATLNEHSNGGMQNV